MKTNKITTVRDARIEKLMADEVMFAKHDAAQAKRQAKIFKAIGLNAEPKPHATHLHPRIGTLSRWDANGNPTYYIWQGQDMITSTSVEELMGYINAETN